MKKESELLWKREIREVSELTPIKIEAEEGVAAGEEEVEVEKVIKMKVKRKKAIKKVAGK